MKIFIRPVDRTPSPSPERRGETVSRNLAKLFGRNSRIRQHYIGHIYRVPIADHADWMNLKPEAISKMLVMFGIKQWIQADIPAFECNQFIAGVDLYRYHAVPRNTQQSVVDRV